MTPKEKAKELVEKFSATYIVQPNGIVMLVSSNPKKCALILVDEILNEFPQGYNGNFEEKRKQYWHEVRCELK